jgi:hypothetical protein
LSPDRDLIYPIYHEKRHLDGLLKEFGWWLKKRLLF